MSECFGELYSLPSNCDGAWNKRLIRILSELHCSFGESTQPISCCGPHTLPCSQFKYCWIVLCFIGQLFSNFFVSFVSTVVPGTRWDVNATNSDLASLLWVNSSLRLTAWSSACRGPFSAGATLAFLLSQLYRSGFAQLDLD